MTRPVRFLQIEPTTRCNFTCGFCAGRAMTQSDLPFARFEAALAAFPELEHVELQGEGEPLMHPRFFDMIARAQQRGVKVSFITNGSLLTPDAIDRILAGGVEKVSVSMESADAETFREIRGGKLEKVLRGVEALIATRNARSLQRPAVGLSVTVLRSTRAHLPEILSLYDRLGLDGGITLQPLQAMDAYVRHYDSALAEERLSAVETDEVWGRFFSDAKLRSIQSRRVAVGFFDALMEGFRPAGRSCPWLERGLYVHNGGAVTACCMVKDTARFSLGQLGEGGVAPIVEARERMREELGRGVVPAPCEGCELARFAVMGRGDLVRFGLRGLRRRWFGHDTPDPDRRVRLKVLDQP